MCRLNNSCTGNSGGNVTSKCEQGSVTGSIAGVLRGQHGTTFKGQLAFVVLGYLAVASVEVFAHWLITLQPCRILLRLYLLHTPTGGVSLFPDFLLPAVFLGWWNGRVGSMGPARRSRAFALLLALGTIGLMPIYAYTMDLNVWWWPRGSVLVAHFLTVEFFFAAICIFGLTEAMNKGSRSAR
jgi:hypothetical protein